ncbi:hypothetical protein Tco_1323535, partial [Tanacetum coccineum]
ELLICHEKSSTNGLDYLNRGENVKCLVYESVIVNLGIDM